MYIQTNAHYNIYDVYVEIMMLSSVPTDITGQHFGVKVCTKVLRTILALKVQWKTSTEKVAL